MVIAGGLACLATLALIGALLFSTAGLSTTVRLVDSLSGGGIVVGESHGRLAGAWRLENVVVEMSGHRITIGELACRWQPRKLLRGTLSIGALTARQVTVTLADTEQEESETAPVKGPGELPSLSLPLAVLLGSLEIDDLTVQDEAGSELFSLISMSAGLTLEHGQLNLTEVRLQTSGFQADLAGSVSSTGDWPLDLDGSWSVALPGCNRLRGTAAVSGLVAAAEISLQVEYPQAVTLNSTLTGLPGHVSWQMQADGRQLNPAAICPAWPAAMLDLSLAASGSDSDYHGDITITAAVPDLPSVSMTLPVSGTLTELALENGHLEGVGGSSRLDGRLSWRDGLSWQLELDGNGFDPGFFNSSLAGPLDLAVNSEGRVDDSGLSWQVELADLHYRTQHIDEPLTGGARLTGTAAGLEGDVQLTAGESSASWQGTVGWLDGVDWDGRVVLDAFDPSLFEDLPGGAIDAAIASHGRRSGQHIEVEATVERLSGRLAGYQIAGGGGVTYRDGRLLVSDLQVNNGANRLVIDGMVDDRLDLQILVEGAELERLYEPLRGDATLSGRLSGTRSAPVLDGRLTATSLSYRGYGLQSGSGTIRFGHDGPETIDVAVQVRELTGEGVRVEGGGLQVVGSRGDHRVDLDLRTAAGNLSMTLAGALSDQWRWAGTLQDAGFESETYGDWQQRDSAACLFGADRATIDGLCITSGASSLCSDGAWHAAGDWSVDLSSLRLALGDLHGWGVVNSPLAGTIEGNLSVDGEGALLRHAVGTLSAAELSVTVGEDGWYPELQWNDSRLDVELTDKVLVADLSSRFSDDRLLGWR
jgi:translocation and assembly module TamB